MSQVAGSILNVGFPTSAAQDLAVKPVDHAFRQLREEYQAQQALFQAQPDDVQRFLESQAAVIAQALTQHQRHIQFWLPEQVTDQDAGPLAVATEFRKQVIGGLWGRLPVSDIRAATRQRLAQLEQSPYRAVSLSASLLRYATVKTMVHDLLPTGEPVIYRLAEGDVIPTVSPDYADGATPISRRFYLSQWVAFDDDRMIVDSLAEAEARVASMQQFSKTLHLAVSLAPYIFADEEYQRKRYGILGQLINQGRALARYQVGVIVGKIQRRAEAGELNRGFSLSLPYFDEQMLEMKMYDFEVVPPGRIMFIPALVWQAARREQQKVEQDTRLSLSTRIHLLAELGELEQAFSASPEAIRSHR